MRRAGREADCPGPGQSGSPYLQLRGRLHPPSLGSGGTAPRPGGCPCAPRLLLPLPFLPRGCPRSPLPPPPPGAPPNSLPCYQPLAPQFAKSVGSTFPPDSPPPGEFTISLSLWGEETVNAPTPHSHAHPRQCLGPERAHLNPLPRPFTLLLFLFLWTRIICVNPF